MPGKIGPHEVQNIPVQRGQFDFRHPGEFLRDGFIPIVRFQQITVLVDGNSPPAGGERTGLFGSRSHVFPYRTGSHRSQDNARFPGRLDFSYARLARDLAWLQETYEALSWANLSINCVAHSDGVRLLTR